MHTQWTFLRSVPAGLPTLLEYWVSRPRPGTGVLAKQRRRHSRCETHGISRITPQSPKVSAAYFS
eukprot:2723213-Pleurochrysis_carterae.AAC.1